MRSGRENEERRAMALPPAIARETRDKERSGSGFGHG